MLHVLSGPYFFIPLGALGGLLLLGLSCLSFELIFKVTGALSRVGVGVGRFFFFWLLLLLFFFF